MTKDAFLIIKDGEIVDSQPTLEKAEESIKDCISDSNVEELYVAQVKSFYNVNISLELEQENGGNK